MDLLNINIEKVKLRKEVIFMTKSERFNKICKNYIIACDLFNEENTLYQYRFFVDNEDAKLYLDFLISDECFSIPLVKNKLKLIKPEKIKYELDILLEDLRWYFNEN